MLSSLFRSSAMSFSKPARPAWTPQEELRLSNLILAAPDLDMQVVQQLLIEFHCTIQVTTFLGQLRQRQVQDAAGHGGATRGVDAVHDVTGDRSAIERLYPVVLQLAKHRAELRVGAPMAHG